MNKLDFTTVKDFYSAKYNVKRMRRQASEWEKIFAKDVSDEELLLKMYKELLQLNTRKLTTALKMSQRPEQRPYRENIQKTNKHMKICH